MSSNTLTQCLFHYILLFFLSSFRPFCSFSFFFFNDTATTEIYTLSLHDALPILLVSFNMYCVLSDLMLCKALPSASRSEEHTSELQSRLHLVCRLLLEKKKKKKFSTNK